MNREKGLFVERYLKVSKWDCGRSEKTNVNALKLKAIKTDFNKTLLSSLKHLSTNALMGNKLKFQFIPVTWKTSLDLILPTQIIFQRRLQIFMSRTLLWSAPPKAERKEKQEKKHHFNITIRKGIYIRVKKSTCFHTMCVVNTFLSSPEKRTFSQYFSVAVVVWQ